MKDDPLWRELMEQSVKRADEARFAAFPEGSKDYLLSVALTLQPGQKYEHTEETASGTKIGWLLQWDYKDWQDRKKITVFFRHGACGFRNSLLFDLPTQLM